MCRPRWWRIVIEIVRDVVQAGEEISVALTEDQVLRREKDVTRRIGWLKLQPGTLLSRYAKGRA